MKRAMKFTAFAITLFATNLVFAQANSSSSSNSSAAAVNNAGAGTVNAGGGTNVTSTASSASSNVAAVSNHSVNYNYSGTTTIKTTPSMFAPALVTSMNETCMGSFSSGISLLGFGFSAGKTVVSDECVRRLDAKEFREMGLNDVALALLCQSPENQKATNDAGIDCNTGLKKDPP